MPISEGALILASASPRRRELLERFWGSAGFQVIEPVFDENEAIRSWLQRSRGHNSRLIQLESSHLESEQAALDAATTKNAPDEYGYLAEHLAAGKAQHTGDLPQPCLVIAADTLVLSDRGILGKPENEAQAETMLNELSGTWHQVITGLALFAVANGQSRLWTAHERTQVRFGHITPAQIRWYIQTGEPLDKAGAYGIQGCGSVFIETINGCYYNVMGLPVNRLMTLLQHAAITSSECTFDFISGFIPWD